MKKSERLSWALGWASLGIGLTELAFAEGISRALGWPRRRADVVRAFGIRELSNGWGLLLQPHRREWVWGRVAGDAIDLAVLATTFSNPRADRRWQGALTATVVGALVLDLYAAMKRGGPVLGARAGKPSLDTGLHNGGPAESWRGSGLAEDVGVSASSGAGEESEEVRQRMMDEAARKLGFPDLKESGSSY